MRVRRTTYILRRQGSDDPQICHASLIEGTLLGTARVREIDDAL